MGDNLFTVADMVIADNSFFVLPAVLLSFFIALMIVGMNTTIQAMFTRILYAVILSLITFIGLLFTGMVILIISGVIKGIY